MNGKNYKVFTIYPGIEDRPEIEWLVEYLKGRGVKLSSVAIPYLVRESKRLRKSKKLNDNSE